LGGPGGWSGGYGGGWNGGYGGGWNGGGWGWSGAGWSWDGPAWGWDAPAWGGWGWDGWGWGVGLDLGVPYDPWLWPSDWGYWGWSPDYISPAAYWDWGWSARRHRPYRDAPFYVLDEGWAPPVDAAPIPAAYSPGPVVTTNGVFLDDCADHRWVWDPDLGGYVQQRVWDCWST